MKKATNTHTDANITEGISERKQGTKHRCDVTHDDVIADVIVRVMSSKEKMEEKKRLVFGVAGRLEGEWRGEEEKQFGRRKQDLLKLLQEVSVLFDDFSF